MRIAILSTEGLGFGGAVRATRRLVAGLTQRGHEAIIISVVPGHDPCGIGIEVSPARAHTERLARAASAYLQKRYISARRTTLSNTLFSPQVAGYSFKESRILDDFDIVNIHWVARFLAPHTVAEFLATRKPVIFTLHDMLAFTGGCHYSAGCQGFRETCTPCPQLNEDVLKLAAWTLERKRRLFRATNVSAIAPSRWLADCAAESGVFAPENISTIPNAVEIDLFRPTRKQIAKESLGIDPSVKTLLFGAGNNREHRKGFDLLVEMLHRLKSDPRVDSLLAEQRLRVLVFGAGTPELLATGIPLLNLGAVRNDSRLALIYSAADLLILPSREDNLPNIMLEAMSCATPVISFGIGGIRDVILDRVDGRLIPPFDIAAMASAVTDLLHVDGAALAMGCAARDKMVSAYHLDAQAAAYETLFESMLGKTDFRSTKSSCSRTHTPKTIRLPLTLHPQVEKTSIGLFLEQQTVIDETKKTNERARVKSDRVRDVLRFKSWELTAPLRLIARGIRAASRMLNPARTVCKADPVRAPKRSASPPSSSVVRLDSASLTRQDRPIDTDRSLNPICLHLYHLDLWDEFKTALKPIIGRNTPLYISLPESNAHFMGNIYRDIEEQYCRVFVLENRGLDIYPFLSQFKFLLDQGIRPLTLTKLHTKKSKHHTNEFADAWRTGLYQNLLANHGVIVDKFYDKTLGMVCGQRWWVHETPGNRNYEIERRVIHETCKIFNVSQTYSYVTGSMYIISFEYLKSLFSEIDIDKFLTRFETGYKPSDTLAHGFERVVCFGLEKYGRKVGLL